MNNFKIQALIVGSFGAGAIENSFFSGFVDNEINVEKFDMASSIDTYCRFGRIGKLINKFIPIEPWIRKANRDLLIDIKNKKINLLIIIGQNYVMTGTLSQIKAMFDLKIVHIWQDSLTFLNSNLINSIKLYDLICTYSKSSIPIFKLYGGKEVLWLPLAADPHLHKNTFVKNEYSADLTFIGQWRPEREAAINALLKAIPNLNLKIWGLDWKRNSKNKIIIKSWQGKSLYGLNFSRAVGLSKLNLNVIDDTNYPAANMRFFEIPCSGGIQLCSECPEMSDYFENRLNILFFKDYDELVSIVKNSINNIDLLENIRQQSYNLVMHSHTYKNRVESIITKLYPTF
jgi:spore maturation protein CgeB